MYKAYNNKQVITTRIEISGLWAGPWLVEALGSSYTQ